MTSPYLSHLFEYDSDMNLQLLNKLRSLQNVDDKTKSIFSHVLGAKRIWIKRLNCEDLSGITVWPVMNWDECEALIEENQTGYRDFLTG